MPVLTPLWRQSLQERFFKIYTPNDPSDENFFFDIYKNVYIQLLVDVYSFQMVRVASWRVQLQSRTIFVKFLFSKISRIAFSGPEPIWGGQKLITEDNDDREALICWLVTECPFFILWNIPCIIFIDIKLIKVHFLTLF